MDEPGNVTTADVLRIEAATWADAPAVRTVLARAYRDNPLMVWALPDAATRDDACAAWLGPSVDRYLADGRVHVARARGVLVGAPTRDRKSVV